MARRRLKWTAKQQDKLNKVIEVLAELEDYKPLTLRQVYYQLVSREYIENKVSQYNMLSNLLKWARIDGYVSWDDIEDRVRAFHNAEGWQDKRRFLDGALSSFLERYRRNLWQTQKRYVEVWIEKDALSSIFTRVCAPYGISVVVCRGFSSVSFLHDFSNRLASRNGRKPVMLYFGDFDPSGVEMLTAMKTTLKDELGVKGMQFKRIALLKDDIFTHKLPNNPNALKKTDTRSRKHVAAYGELAVELDALRPDVLEQKIEDAVKAQMNVRAYNREVDLYNKEMGELRELQKRIMRVAR
jgi:hypothetical protein